MKKRIAKTLKKMAESLEAASKGEIPQPETKAGRAFAAVVIHRVARKMKGFQKTNGRQSVYYTGVHRFYKELKVMYKQGLVRV